MTTEVILWLVSSVSIDRRPRSASAERIDEKNNRRVSSPGDHEDVDERWRIDAIAVVSHWTSRNDDDDGGDQQQ